jgi:hypothetical protein
MDREFVEKHIESMGARVKYRPLEQNSRLERELPSSAFRIDVLADKRGEYFEIAQGKDSPKFEILQIRPKEHHMLLYSRDGQRFLLGFDERHWFAAGIKDAVSTIRDAKRSLMPEEILEQVRGLPPGKIDNRRNPAFMRQGEWFFVPSNRRIDEMLILKNEPLQRAAGSKPHLCQELYREGGELVYIVDNLLFTEDEFKRQRNEDSNFAPYGYRTMMRNPDVYVRGYVRHVDHATINLRGWHRVYINEEFTTASVSFPD